MAIKVKNTTGVIPVTVTDTVLLTVEGKFGIEAANLHNSSTNNITVSVYSSPDDTSAGGSIVAKEILAPDEDMDINAIVGQGYVDQRRLIAKADLTGVNCSVTYTSFTGEDV